MTGLDRQEYALPVPATDNLSQRLERLEAMTTTNEAVERLQLLAVSAIPETDVRGRKAAWNLVENALVAERRATVERIRERLDSIAVEYSADMVRDGIRAILDEEAAR